MKHRRSRGCASCRADPPASPEADHAREETERERERRAQARPRTVLILRPRARHLRRRLGPLHCFFKLKERPAEILRQVAVSEADAKKGVPARDGVEDSEDEITRAVVNGLDRLPDARAEAGDGAGVGAGRGDTDAFAEAVEGKRDRDSAVRSAWLRAGEINSTPLSVLPRAISSQRLQPKDSRIAELLETR